MVPADLDGESLLKQVTHQSVAGGLVGAGLAGGVVDQRVPVAAGRLGRQRAGDVFAQPNLGQDPTLGKAVRMLGHGPFEQ